ncbi:MAG: 50S ribosomal protein L20 [Bacilli bacterium]|jgi:large subunit ribosomal protein L20|nr:50S ribosomal protein L20 [Bacilli bacterium]MDY0063456.1 50S ribosomal protein L20 [Bacilli bacterium]
MPRTKGGFVTRRRRKRILKLAKGYFGSKHALYRVANAQVMKSLSYAYRDRRQKKREFRRLWIARINAGARLHELSYNKLMFGLKLADVTINRKMLSELAIHEPTTFATLCDTAKKAIAKKAK